MSTEQKEPIEVSIIEMDKVYWWVSKTTQEAAGKEFPTKKEAEQDAKKRLGLIKFTQLSTDNPS